MKIFNNTETESDSNRGQVGIGTLIVFIAMVLVAAIAAGVLINTAGFLQTQAEDTGTESTQQVADAINVITEVGEVSANDEINEVRLGVQPAAGAADINLAGLTLQFLSDDSFEELTVGEDDGEEAGGDSSPGDVTLSNESQASFLVSPVTAEDDDDIVMTDGSDRYELVIPLDGTSGEWGTERETETDEVGGGEEPLNEGDGLDEGDTFTLGENGFFDGDPEAPEDFIVSVDNATVLFEDDDADDIDVTDDFEILSEDDEDADADGETIRYTGDDIDVSNDDEVEFELTFADRNPFAQGDLSALDEGTDVQVTITTDVGSQTVAFLQVPDSLVGPDEGETVNL